MIFEATAKSILAKGNEMPFGDRRVIIVHHEDVCLIGDLHGYGEAAQRKFAKVLSALRILSFLPATSS